MIMEYLNCKDFKIEYDTVVTFGKFDGIHNGHKLLIEKAKELANSCGLKVVLCTFDMSAWKSTSMSQITTMDEKKIICETLGVDILLDYPFDNEIASMEPEGFINDFVKNKLNAKYVVVGSDWRFGQNRAGDANLLNSMQDKYGYEAVVLDKILSDGKEISSTWIREELANGNVRVANELLGYKFFFYGQVVAGKKLGRTIGFPTVNIAPGAEKLLPKFGVYKTEVVIDGVVHTGVTNVGIRPTVDNDNRVTVETFIIDFNEDVYGKNIEIKLCDFIRAEKKFDSVEALKKQLDTDIENAKK